jgi:hypothetical protein
MRGLTRKSRAAQETMKVYLKPSEEHNDFLDAHCAGDGGARELRCAVGVGGCEVEGDV